MLCMNKREILAAGRLSKSNKACQKAAGDVQLSTCIIFRQYDIELASSEGIVGMHHSVASGRILGGMSSADVLYNGEACI